ncbi:MAG: deoxyribose-phosphate aldolase [Clostridia bacterium]|nr:deoxyribose-phosphate aldolase [Clostridia bacterium]
MDIKNILSKCDHTLLSVTATQEDIKAILDDAMRYGVASACIPPSYVEFAKSYVGDSLKICTVIGFPNGYNTTACKVFETLDAIKKGADEIDMVINIGKLKSGDYDYVLDEIKSVKDACQDRTLKVIIETCLLTEEEKVKMCQAVTEAGADFIKTSTGFSTYGATFDDISLFKANVGNGVKIKAAGGIKTLDDAQKFIELGADRLGTSKVVKAVKEVNYDGNSDPSY